jgi:hypothetical protein
MSDNEPQTSSFSYAKQLLLCEWQRKLRLLEMLGEIPNKNTTPSHSFKDLLEKWQNNTITLDLMSELNEYIKSYFALQILNEGKELFEAYKLLDKVSNKPEESDTQSIHRSFGEEYEYLKPEKIADFFGGLEDLWTGNLNVHFKIDESKCIVSISLDHLGKEEVIKRISEGGLVEEIHMLYVLAHLPYAEFYTMNINGYDFDIIDRVRINLHLAFHPLHDENYPLRAFEMKHWHMGYEEMETVEKGLTWIKQRATK